MSPPAVLKVAMPAPLRTLFDYLPPEGGPIPVIGGRVRAPFGKGERIGVILAEGPPAGPVNRLKRITECLDAAPLLQAVDRELLQWAARYYQHPIGEVVAAALPVRLRRGNEASADRVLAWRVTAEGQGLDLEDLRRSPRQRALIEQLRAAQDALPMSELAGVGGGDVGGALKRLAARGLVESVPIAGETGIERGKAVEGPLLNRDQTAAVAAVTETLGRFEPFLLDGVTGSGKTEVYIALARQVLAAGRQVLVLVPEISLTPQLVRRLMARIDGRFALFHSGRSEGERERAWLAAARGEADILIGTRSALFAPLPRLGLVVVDEEHDPSFKQQEGFRYSARDLALVKARLSDCPVVLGSATPSLESVANADLGRYRRLQLTERAGGAAHPVMALVDVRAQRLEGGLAPPLLREMRAELAAGHQVLLFLNRRGYAPVLTCHACGWIAQCPHCDARLTWHAAAARLWCHHCGYQHRQPPACPECAGEDLRALGQGTERLEETLGRLFPEASLVRVDRDATRRKGSLEKALAAARSGAASLLIGTQMLAKGHHFPGVTLVGILDADAGLFGVDFRSPERTAQLLAQVAGRAGRADKPGRVLIQTRHPDNPQLGQLIRDGYGAFAAAELVERRAAHLPPFSRQALVRAEAANAEAPHAFLNGLAQQVREESPQVEVWGPVPAPMEKRAGRYRAHLLLQADSRPVLQRCLDRLMDLAGSAEGARRVRWSLDVDPVDLV